MRTDLKDVVRRAILRTIHKSGIRQSDRKIAEEAQAYWGNTDQNNFRSNSHWRGDLGLSDEVWLELGKPHVCLLRNHLKIAGLKQPLRRIVEWGCGGGANAIHFAKEAHEYVGVDVSDASLAECQRNLNEVGYENFVPVLIEVAQPEDAVDAIHEACDLFLCTYVFELIPSPEYGQRLLKIAHHLLHPGGLAIIQIKYETHESHTRTRRWGYRSNIANMTTYPIEVFWQLTEEVGFKPQSVSLRPKDDLVHDERYAYFVLEKPKVRGPTTACELSEDCQ
ncbi:MAG: class I SAM-dependent methyltransferase [Shinella sp.]|nr:class I SAM-dependent methyltransferase [Shinella sp.]